jgi:hypothetical protein
MGQVVGGWSYVTAQTLANIWNGTIDPNLSTLSGLVSNGHFFGGKGLLPPTVSPSAALNTLTASIETAYYGFAIPALWSVSGAYPFILDAGYSCNGQTPDGSITYMSPADQAASVACVNGKAYYLASAAGGPISLLSPPPGVGSLGPNAWGGVSLMDLVTG